MTLRLLKAALATIATAVALAGGPALAITNGDLDGTRHPYVGLMVAQTAKGEPLWRCSGTLLSPTIFLTAGHCTEAPAAKAEIWFDADVEHFIPQNGYPNKGEASGKTFTHPQYDPNRFFLYDLGVVVLKKPVALPRYAALPAQDVLDRMVTLRGLQDVTFTAVGYGLQQINPVFVESERVRMVA
ncbi:MAG: trypsin-like serine protease, partial [Steroidobacteraceae bacterium]